MLIRYYGHVGQQSGYAVAGAEMCMAILSAGLNLEISTTGTELPQRFGALLPHIKDEAALTANPDVVIVHTMPLSCGQFLASRPELHCYDDGGGEVIVPLRVAYTTWEGASPASEAVVRALEGYHQVWVPSRHTRDILVQGGVPDAKVIVVPHAYDETYWEVVEPEEAPEQRASDPFRFYYIGAWTVRKNPQGVIQAFLRAFSRFDNVELVMQVTGAAQAQATMTQLATGIPQSEWPVVRVTSDRVSDLAILALHVYCDCFVSASRGESWNLPAFEAMLAGRHIIAPAHQGSDDFLAITSADLYGSRLAPAGGEIIMGQPVDGQPGMVRAQYVGTQGLTAKDDWREPDIAELAMLMRRAYAEKRRKLVRHYLPSPLFGTRAVGALIAELLKQ
jgi:hypothetical protein